MSEYIPDGFQVVQLDADYKEITEEEIAEAWDKALEDSVDEAIVPYVKTLFSFIDKETMNLVFVSDRMIKSLDLVVSAPSETASQHDWISAETVQKDPKPMARDYVSNPWLSHNRDSGIYRYEYREPIAEPADRAGQGFLGNVIEQVGTARPSCNVCNLERARNGACGC